MNGRGVQSWVNGFLAEDPVAAIPAARGAVAGVAGPPTPRPAGIAFSPFILEHSVAARELSRQLMITARDGGLDAAQAAAESNSSWTGGAIHAARLLQ